MISSWSTCHKILHILMFITSFEEQNITYRSCSNFLIHLSLRPRSVTLPRQKGSIFAYWASVSIYLSIVLFYSCFFTYEYKKIICFLNQVLVENMLRVCLLYARPRKIAGLVRWQHPVTEQSLCFAGLQHPRVSQYFL